MDELPKLNISGVKGSLQMQIGAWSQENSSFSFTFHNSRTKSSEIRQIISKATGQQVNIDQFWVLTEGLSADAVKQGLNGPQNQNERDKIPLTVDTYQFGSAAWVKIDTKLEGHSDL